MEKTATKKQMLIKIYDEVLERNCRCIIDEKFFMAKASCFKKNSPDYKNNVSESKKEGALIYWNNLLLKTIASLIADEVKAEATKKN